MKSMSVRQEVLKRLIMIPLLVSLSGCVYLVVGGIGALGGYVISPDTIEGLTNNDDLTVWDAASEVIAIMGAVEESSEDAGIIISTIGGSNVTVSITRLSEGTTRLRVKARKHHLPKIQIAQDIYVKIMSRVNE